MKRYALILSTLLISGNAFAAPTANVTASREDTCAAPCYVFFDATTTIDASVSAPWRDLLFEWDFVDTTDDGDGTTWATNGKSKNSAIGSTAAHVFWTDGEYIVEVTVTNPDGETDTDTVTITVDDPDVIWATTDTVCISNGTVAGGDFADCPANAEQVESTTAIADIMDTYTDSAKRILLDRGDSYTWDSSMNIRNQGPGHVGAYGAGADPVITATNSFCSFGNYNDSTSDDWAEDWRFTDLNIDFGGGEYYFIKTYGTAANILIQGNKIRDSGEDAISFNRAVLNQKNAQSGTGGTDSIMFHKIAVVENDIAEINENSNSKGNYPTFISARELGYMGNTIEVSVTSHEPTTRFQFIDRGVIQHNYITGQRSTKAVIKFHSCKWVESYQPCSGEYSEYVVVSDNNFHGGPVEGSWLIEMGPQTKSSPTDERIRYVTYERNYHKLAGANQKGLAGFIADSIARDNIFNLTGSRADTSVWGIAFEYRGAENQIYDITGNQAHNNTCYSEDTKGNPYDIYCAAFNSDAQTDSVAYNNLLYAPDYVDRTVVSGAADSGGNTDAEAVNPFVAATPGDNPSDYVLSAPISNAELSNSYLGFDSVARADFNDVGAYADGGVATVGIPVFSPVTGEFPATSGEITIDISDTVEDAICYTTSITGTPPATPVWESPNCTTGTEYTSAISAVSVTTAFKARGFKAAYNDSTIASVTYTLNQPDVDIVTFDPVAGSYETSASVELATDTPTPEAICYTDDESTPTYSSGCTGTSTAYSVAIDITEDTTLIAAAFKDGYDSITASEAGYIITTAEQLSTSPVLFDNETGSYESTVDVTLTTATPAPRTIYYNTVGGYVFTEYTAPLTITTDGTVLRAYVFKTGYNVGSLETETYTITPPQVATPVFTPSAGTFEVKSIEITVETDTVGDTIYYTTNGAIPSDADPDNEYQGPFTLTETTIIKAIGILDGYENSEMSTGTYTVVDRVFSAGRLCTLQGCAVGGSGIGFGGSGRVTFTMDIPSRANSYSCSATPSVQIECRSGDANSNWAAIPDAVLSYGTKHMISVWQPSGVCRGVVVNGLDDCTDFLIQAVSN